MDRAAQIVARLGATIEQVSLPDLELFAACGRVIMLAEAYAIHEHQLRERARDYGRRTFQHFILGAAISASDLVHAFRLRRELTTTLNTQLFATYDALVTLTALAPAPPFSDFSDGMPRTQPLLTAPFNVSGNPALAMPIGLSESGLPLGMQIVGRAFDEPTVFQIAAAFEAAGEIRQHARLDVAASPYQSIERTQP
jgi:aspartyl-tRNA(Asn)/glutamyl-tRNA(Gln) amidotransferase subunit A